MIRPPCFVTSTTVSLGIGKLLDWEADRACIEYFVSPVQAGLRHDVPRSALREVALDEQTRVYFRNPDTRRWRAARVLFKSETGYRISFRSEEDSVEVPIEHLYVRCEQPIDDPTNYLACLINETPRFHVARSAFVRSLAEQRAVSEGLAGLISSVISLEPHQIEVVRRVLRDPIQRYLLADEVGLGKMIEAGILLRQYVLDHPHDHRVLILVPPHLGDQWHEELRVRFRLHEWLGKSIRVMTTEEDTWMAVRPPGMLIVDEAHHVAVWAEASEDTALRQRFEAIRQLAIGADRLLLLSATPVLNHEVAFQALLHLLDPIIYPLGDMEPFRRRIAHWEDLAEIFHVFVEHEPNGFLMERLQQLQAFFPQDRRLAALAAELSPKLDLFAPAEDPQRLSLIRAIRNHLCETYRLHRRLLRNRRAHETVRDLIPGRHLDGLAREEYPDPVRRDLEETLDRWRLAVSTKYDAGSPQRTELAALGLMLMTACASDPRVLAQMAQARLAGSGLPAGTGLSSKERSLLACRATFEEEESLLDQIVTAVRGMTEDPRHEALAEFIETSLMDRNNNHAKAIVFADLPPTADRISATLTQRFGTQVVRHSASRDTWSPFLDSSGPLVLVCDRFAEDGLNLQGKQMLVVHYDLPWSPNRVEQRIGRVDRYGAGERVESWALLAEECRYEAAWADCLDEAFGVFRRSIASLQYLIEDEMAQLSNDLLANGLEALKQATQRLAGKDGEVERQLLRIQRLDELDAIEISLELSGESPSISQGDSLGAIPWFEALKEWVVERLLFENLGINGRDDPVRRFRFRRGNYGHQTLMPVSRATQYLQHCIAAAGAQQNLPNGYYTYPLTCKRMTAQKYGVALARFGDPFIDGMAEHVRWDDSGVCFAVWRHRPKLGAARIVRRAFRFDFLIEAATSAAEAVLRKFLGTTVEATRRQADQWFRPRFVTIWLDEEFESITDKDQIAQLDWPYRPDPRPGQPGDYNLNFERWQQLISDGRDFDLGNWETLCHQARVCAEEKLKETVELSEQICRSVSHAKEQVALWQDQLLSRVDYLPPEQRIAEREEISRMQRLTTAVIAGIERPIVRLDSLGVVFLASWTPFTSAVE